MKLVWIYRHGTYGCCRGSWWPEIEVAVSLAYSDVEPLGIAWRYTGIRCFWGQR